MTEREQFVATMTTAGLPPSVVETILRNATTIERCAELACSSEAADRDRIPCPSHNAPSTTDSCLCRDYGYFVGPGATSYDGSNPHRPIPRHLVQSERAERRIEAALETVNASPLRSQLGNATRFDAEFQGDPRGYTTKILRPGDRRGEQYSDGVGVPVRVR